MKVITSPFGGGGGTGGGIPDAPSDGVTRGRKDGAWEEVTTPAEVQALLDAAPADVATWSVAKASTALADADVAALSRTDAHGNIIRPNTGDLLQCNDGVQYRLTNDTYGTLSNWVAVAVVNTSFVGEGSNLYFTTARVLATAIASWATTAWAAITASDTITSFANKAGSALNVLMGASTSGFVWTNNGTTGAWAALPSATTSDNGVVKLADATAIDAGTAGRVVDAAQLKGAQSTIIPSTNSGTNNQDVSIGATASGNSLGVAVGAAALGFTNGCAVGYSANGTSTGACLGYLSNASLNGAAIGASSIGGTYGVAAGYKAKGGVYGISIGNNCGNNKASRVEISPRTSDSTFVNRFSMDVNGQTSFSTHVTDSAPTDGGAIGTFTNADGTLCRTMVGVRVSADETTLKFYYTTAAGTVKVATLALT